MTTKLQTVIGGNSCKRTKFVMLSTRTGTLRRSEMRTRNTISTQTMPSVNTLSRVNESSGELICRPCEAIIRASLQGFNVRRILGKGDLWITEYIITYQGRPTFTVSIMEFRDGKVMHETQYFADPFEAPDWRSQWVQRIS